MSRYFVNDPPVAIPEWTDADGIISDTPPNVIYIRARMNVEVQGKVTSELLTLDKDGKGMEAHLGANQQALLVHNIVRWEGPDLGSVPCTPENIRTLDPNEPHIALVLEEIAKRNAKRTSPNAKPATTSTATNDTAPALIASPTHADDASLSSPSASGTSRSPLLRSLDGRRDRSENVTQTT